MTPAEITQLMRLVGTGEMREELERLEKTDPAFLARLAELFTRTKRKPSQVST